MTEKDLKAQFKRETGKYSPLTFDEKNTNPAGLVDYIEWLEEQVIKLEKENYQMKLEQNSYKGPIIH